MLLVEQTHKVKKWIAVSNLEFWEEMKHDKTAF